MRRRTALLVAGATAIALALGGAPGGRARRGAVGRKRPAGRVEGARAAGALAGRPQPLRLGGEPSRGCGSGSAARRRRARAARLRVPAPLARDGRRVLPAPGGRGARGCASGWPDDADAVLGLGSLALIRHEFRSALAYGRRARRLLVGSARPYGVIGDAEIELGRYPQAFAAFERMVSLRPSLGSYARIAYARELTGDRQERRRPCGSRSRRPAVSPSRRRGCSSRSRSSISRSGAPARRSARREADEALPGYPSARVQLARVEAARGHAARAIADAHRGRERAADATGRLAARRPSRGGRATGGCAQAA